MLRLRLLATALESALLSGAGLGVELLLEGSMEPHRALFGEGPSRVIVSVSSGTLGPVLEHARAETVPLAVCGRVTSGWVRVAYNGREILSMAVDEVFSAWDRSLERRLHPAEVA